MEDLIPLVPRATLRPRGGALTRTIQPAKQSFRSDRQFTAFLVDPDGATFAMKFLRSVSARRWHWVLPPGCSVKRWVLHALDQLSDEDVASFPRRTSWATDDRYLSRAETAANARLSDIDEAEVRHAREIATARIGAESDLVAARHDAELGPRRLVTSQGDDLVSEVAMVLARLGFLVHDSDSAAVPGDKLEDLQVRLPDNEDDVALVEVRSYTGGAQLRDLLRINRFVTRFVAKTNAEPSRR